AQSEAGRSSLRRAQVGLTGPAEQAPRSGPPRFVPPYDVARGKRRRGGAASKEQDMKRFPFTATLAPALVLGGAATSGPGAAARRVGAAAARPYRASATGLTIRWDIVSYDFQAAPVTVSEGGKASSKAPDRSGIELTGSGTCGGAPTNVSGGGDWTTFWPSGRATGSGSYTVKALLEFFAAPGAFGDASGQYELVDRIGDSADAHPGLALLRVAYSDGSQGILTISSRQAGTPPTVFMGITATKG